MTKPEEEGMRDQIVGLLKEKAVMKQDVLKSLREAFNALKNVSLDIAGELEEEIRPIDERVIVSFTDKGDQEFEIRAAGDTLVCYMHTNVFEFDKSHAIFKTSQGKESEYNTYCGIINIYNFLTQSLKFNRLNDPGYLVCRIFINRNNHFFVESKTPVGYKYSALSNTVLNPTVLKEIMYTQLVNAVQFDLHVPPFDAVREVSVAEIQQRIFSEKLKTAKRLGYIASTETGNYVKDQINL
jgi:hypothetical protein